MLVRYKGNRERQLDSLFDTGVVWHGDGDVQEVPDKAALALVTYCANNFERVEPESEAPKRVTPDPALTAVEAGRMLTIGGRQVPMHEASRAELVRYAGDEYGLAVSDGHSREQIIQAIVDFADMSARVASSQARALDTAAEGSGAEAGSAGERRDANDGAPEGTGGEASVGPTGVAQPADTGGLAGLMPQK